MTEAEWLAYEDPRRMLVFLDGSMGKSKVGRRKIRLLLAGCCRQAWHHFVDPKGQKLIEASECYADGLLSYRKFREMWGAVYKAGGAHLACMACHYQLWAAAKDGWPSTMTGEPLPNASEKVHLVRDIFGNPFRPVKLDPTWLTSDVLLLARGIYEERAFDRMPILADALQDAGCANDEVLNHCRGAGPHVRGCWVLDLLLGKE